MDFLWAPLLLVLAVVLYIAWQILRFVRHTPRGKVAFVRQSSGPHRSSPRATRKTARNLK
jgi:flagellar biogenesis protein FliO